MRPRRWAGGGGGGGGGGAGDIGSGRGISWDDPLRSDSRIFVFFEKAFRTDRPTGPRTDPLVGTRERKRAPRWRIGDPYGPNSRLIGPRRAAPPPMKESLKRQTM